MLQIWWERISFTLAGAGSRAGRLERGPGFPPKRCRTQKITTLRRLRLASARSVRPASLLQIRAPMADPTFDVSGNTIGTTPGAFYTIYPFPHRRCSSTSTALREVAPRAPCLENRQVVSHEVSSVKVVEPAVRVKIGPEARASEGAGTLLRPSRQSWPASFYLARRRRLCPNLLKKTIANRGIGETVDQPRAEVLPRPEFFTPPRKSAPSGIQVKPRGRGAVSACFLGTVGLGFECSRVVDVFVYSGIAKDASKENAKPNNTLLL